MTESIHLNQKPPFTREQMQAEAVAIEALLHATMATLNTIDSEDAFGLVELARIRAQRLNQALDSLYVQEDAA